MQAMAPQVAAPVAVVEVPVEETKYVIINSNHWNFYRKPSPDKPMFVEVGNTIAKGMFYV
jgi:acetyl-CoA carboxylase biotin carboxyl carrier protein